MFQIFNARKCKIFGSQGGVNSNHLFTSLNIYYKMTELCIDLPTLNKFVVRNIRKDEFISNDY